MDNNLLTTTLKEERIQFSSQFYHDVITGLTSTPKYLQSKYFYDAAGDKLFQEIMESPEYYPTDCEMEIFATQHAEMVRVFNRNGDDFDLIELGVGDATKSIYLLKHLLKRKAQFTYRPIDISENIISYLNLTLPVALPGLKMESLNGDYFDMLKKLSDNSTKRKVVLFLGANIGNMSVTDAGEFCYQLSCHLSPGDMVIVGIDLKKNPKTVLGAYNDAGGLTKLFNLNLLNRINRELAANFDLTQFEHYANYDPATGACQSYLVSLADQVVNIGNNQILFSKDEFIHMEISQKYSLSEISHLATNNGFRPIKNFSDKKKWFIDAVWIRSCQP